MYPLKDELNMNISNYANNNQCIIFIIHGANLKILITGGAGFVCSHLADKLYEKRHS